jgi:hypothetical protein
VSQVQGGPIYLGHVGLRIGVQAQHADGAPFDIRTASGLTVIVRKPNGAVLNCSGRFYTNGIDGKFYHPTASGEISHAGVYTVDGYAEPQSGEAFYFARYQFTVVNNARSGG